MSALSALAAAVFLCASPGITDGDTLRCKDKTRVRIWGIQAPERHEPGGAAATRAMARIVGGADLTCQRKGASYQRVVARCRLPSGQDVAAELVRQGHAKDWPKFSGGAYGR